MKIAVSIGQAAKEAFETVIERGNVTGVTVTGAVVEFDFGDGTPDEQLQIATNNMKALVDLGSEARLADDADVNRKAEYAMGFLSTVVSQLAAQHELAVGENIAAIAADVASTPRVKTARRDAQDADKTVS